MKWQTKIGTLRNENDYIYSKTFDCESTSEKFTRLKYW